MLQSLHSSIVSPLSRSSIGAATLALQYVCSSINAAAFLLSLNSRCSSHAAAFTQWHFRCSSCSAVFTLQLSHGGSAGGRGPLGAHFSTLSTTLTGASPGVGRRFFRGGGGGGILENWEGVLGWGWGEFMYLHILERDVCRLSK